MWEPELYCLSFKQECIFLTHIFFTPPIFSSFLSFKLSDTWWWVGGHSQQSRSPPLAPPDPPGHPKCCGGWREAREGGGRCQGTRAPGCAAGLPPCPRDSGPHIPSSRPPFFRRLVTQQLPSSYWAVPTPGQAWRRGALQEG